MPMIAPREGDLRSRAGSTAKETDRLPSEGLERSQGSLIEPQRSRDGIFGRFLHGFRSLRLTLPATTVPAVVAWEPTGADPVISRIDRAGRRRSIVSRFELRIAMRRV